MLVAFLVACSTPAPTPPTPAAPEAPPAAAPAPSEGASGATLSLSGTISYAGPVDAQAVFVSIRDPANPGPPLAAKKLPPGPFPLAFTLTQADVMQMGAPRPIPDKVSLVIRLDKDGDAMTKDAADPNVTVETTASAADVAVTLAAATP